MTLAIEQLSLDMNELKDECKMNQTVYDDLLEQVQAMLEQRIQEVENGIKSQPFEEFQAQTFNKKVKELENKLKMSEREKDGA